MLAKSTATQKNRPPIATDRAASMTLVISRARLAHLKLRFAASPAAGQLAQEQISSQRERRIIMIDHRGHIVLTTRDKEGCIRFYTEVLGMKLTRFKTPTEER